AEAAIDQATDELIADAVRVDHYGAARIGLDQLRRAAAEICGRLVSRVVQAVRGAAWPPRLARVEGVVRAICARKAGPRLSLGGTVLSLDEASRTITVVREVRASVGAGFVYPIA
ncbi:MAG TPA: hypothetical protein PK264_23510, partial [Hyphomicrobiaceae bacterium]|nr:hypothetical protein [Hyphomicrobiaceae bacterium]